MTSLVFMGTPEFSVPILTMLHEEGYSILAVVTQPDRPVGRKKVLTPTPVKKEALRLGLPVIQPEKLKGSPELDEILSLQPDIVVTAAFGQLLPKEILDAPKYGCLNVHASLLPAYRGGAPIHQAVIDGQTETGVTIMYMAQKLDAGDIISQQAIPIEQTDTTGILFEKLSVVGRDLLKETLPTILNGSNERIVQDESLVTFARNISREQERIDWSQSAQNIYNLVRGLNPWPVAYTTLKQENVKIWWGQPSEQNYSQPIGTVVELKVDRLIVQTGDKQAFEITELQPAGKKKMSAEEFLRGTGSKLQIGDQFE
ncbi:methionyl-tRNA formyltransferase [Paenisporosarcina quisquiliarum]|uniref:Methionyl-tRNA formyltransferase n=1 Tax=Paenisporosarcina quisquiliarum TaxID=365346 RepID=A0A9X3RBT7_9BACL|nr:methionyl-tRNA formyltransferase [Paenisporosarcina quisquiliarum]MCZ8535591.1 methionyl-tRNA formyltransferase [Paenisporosarcina quisquiliarum]